MTWAKLDDSFHSHPKVRAAWYRCPASIGLHVMCVTYAADHETDGVVPGWFVAAFFQRPKDLQAAVATLTDLGMWRQQDEDFVIHDFLEYHPSRAALQRRRAAEAERRLLTPQLRALVISRDESTCGICQLPVDAAEVHIDHILPVSLGGRTVAENLQVTHALCNLRKGARV